MASLSRYEQETIINFNEEDAISSIYTSSRRVVAMLERRGLKPVRVEKFKGDGEPSGWWFEVPKSAILIKPERAAIKIGGNRKKSKGVNL